MKEMIRNCSAAVILSLSLAASVRAAEFGSSTPYYEDDAWYDVTEWFDGNDYNPTDEAWWRFDDETYDASKDTGLDMDSDGWYGFTGRDDNDWYYDYYDPDLYSYSDLNADDLYEFEYRYFDYDLDGFYDAYAVYSDLNADGRFENFDYYYFGDTGRDKQKKQAQKSDAHDARQQSVTGTIQKTKLVKVRGGKQHVVIAIQPQQGQKDQTLIADLGRADELKTVNPRLGDKITVKGPRAQIGKQAIVLARSFDLNGQSKQVNRSPRTITAKVIDTKKSKIRNQEHLIAMVEPSQNRRQNIAVDLGRADQLKVDVKKGSTLTFNGFPVKVKGKPLVMAQSVKQGDQFVQINRQPAAMGAGGTTQKGQGGQDQQKSDQQQKSNSSNTLKQ